MIVVNFQGVIQYENQSYILILYAYYDTFIPYAREPPVPNLRGLTQTYPWL